MKYLFFILSDKSEAICPPPPPRRRTAAAGIAVEETNKTRRFLNIQAYT